MHIYIKVIIVSLTIFFLSGCNNDNDTDTDTDLPPTPKQIVDEAKRIDTSDGWFEVIKLPNDVYAFHEPGHAEHVNSFLILGETKDLLYDTGMGIASIKNAIAEVRKTENLPERELIVLNSHGHLDHIGGNYEFDEILAIDNVWRFLKLTEGIPAGTETFSNYWGGLTQMPNPPEGFSPETMSIKPIDAGKISYIYEGDVIDLGNRKFEVMQARGHTTDSVVLYDKTNKMLFTGDAFTPPFAITLDIAELVTDIKRFSALDVSYHYATHGIQLIDLNLRSIALIAAEKVLNKDDDVIVTEIEILGAPQETFIADEMYFMFWDSMY